MKRTVLPAVLTALLAIATCSAEEPLIPSPINELLWQITPRMPLPELKELLAAKYPKVTEGSSFGSGRGGSQEYRLDDRLSVSVATMIQDGVYVVHPALSFSYGDREQGQGVSVERTAPRDPETQEAARALFNEREHPSVFEERPSYSKEFWEALSAAEALVDQKRSAGPLLALLPRFPRQSEQATLELTIGKVYNQRTGVVDEKKSNVHLSKALALGLTMQRQMEALSWRSGNSEHLKEYASALADELRMLLRCSYYDCSGPAPERPGMSKVAFSKTAPGIQSVSDLDEEITREFVLREEWLQRHRYYSIEAVKRLQKNGKLDDAAVLKQLAVLTQDRRKDEVILGWIRGKNERPWK